MIGENTVSGGIRVMWGLYGHLLAKGQIAYMNRRPSNDIVGIYPEIQQGNPFNSYTTVRFLLNFPGVMGATDQYGNFTPGPTTFDKKDKIYVFSRFFDTFKVPDDHILFLPIANLHVFKPFGVKRKKTCYLIGKGVNQLKHPKGSIELTREFSQDQEALALVLNECHTLYCYDNISAMMELARLCGCKVHYYGEYSEDQLKRYEPGLNGISFGNQDNELDIGAFREHYVGLIKTFEERLGHFIEETQHA